MKCSYVVASILVPFLSPQMHVGATQPPGLSAVSAPVTLGTGPWLGMNRRLSADGVSPMSCVVIKLFTCVLLFRSL